MKFEFQYSSDGSVNSSSQNVLFIQSFKNLQDLNDFVESNQLTCYKTFTHNQEHANSNKTYNTRSKRNTRKHQNKDELFSNTLNGACSNLSIENFDSNDTRNCYNVKKLDDKLFLKYDNQEKEENCLKKHMNASLNACSNATCKLGCVCESLDDSQTTGESYKKRSNNSLINNNSSFEQQQIRSRKCCFVFIFQSQKGLKQQAKQRKSKTLRDKHVEKVVHVLVMFVLVHEQTQLHR